MSKGFHRANSFRQQGNTIKGGAANARVPYADLQKFWNLSREFDKAGATEHNFRYWMFYRKENPLGSALQWIRKWKGTEHHKAAAIQVRDWMLENKHLWHLPKTKRPKS